MSFWSAITGSDTKSTTEQNSTQTSKQTQSNSSVASGNQVTSTLDPGTIALLKSVIGNLGTNLSAGSPDAETIRGVIPLLLNNTDPKQVQAGIDAATQGAIRGYNIGEGAQIGQVQQQIGSKNNSFSQLLQQQGGIDLASTIGQITTTAQANARQQRSSDLSAAIGGSAQASATGVTPLTSLLDSIRTLSGATTTTNTNQSQQQSAIADMLSTLVSQSKTSGSTTNGLIPTFTSLFK